MINEDTPFDDISKIVRQLRQYSHGFKQNIIMYLAGCDFAWPDADYTYNMMDGLMKLIDKY